MAFLTSRNMSEHVLLALGVDHTAMDALQAGGSDFRVSQATHSSQLSVMFPRYTSQVSQASKDVKQML